MHGTVISTGWLTPAMVRLVLGGEGLAGFTPVPYTDAYINVAIPPRHAPYRPPFDLGEVAALPARDRPARRRYTVRRWDPERGELTLDVLVHGAAGVGGRWAAEAAPGDVLVFSGPSGGYRPDPDAAWHLLVGDESALPAIAASLETLPDGVPTVVRLVADGPDHEVDLAGGAYLDVRWLHRHGDETHDCTLLTAAVEELVPLAGRCHAFVHGEAAEVRAIRRHLLTVWGLDRADLSCSPYWRRHLTDEAWRAVKADWNRAVERDVA